MGWPEPLTIALISIVVQVIWRLVRNPQATPVQTWIPPPAPPRSQLFQRARPTAHKTLATAQEGEFITLTGQLQSSKGTLVAPLSGTECVGYAATAWSVGSEREALPIIEQQEMKIASLVVAVEGGEVALEGECVVNLRLTPVSPRDVERETAFLARGRLQHSRPPPLLSEAVLRVGDPVWVTGILASERGGEHGYRDQPLTMRLVGEPGQRLTIGRARRGLQRTRAGRRRRAPSGSPDPT